jgi:hypothetical protein
MITNEEILTELRREMAMRSKLYPGWVEAGKLAHSTATHRILCIAAAIAKIESEMPTQTELAL